MALGATLLKAGDYQVKAALAWRGAERATADTDRPWRGWLQLVKYF